MNGAEFLCKVTPKSGTWYPFWIPIFPDSTATDAPATWGVEVVGTKVLLAETELLDWEFAKVDVEMFCFWIVITCAGMTKVTSSVMVIINNFGNVIFAFRGIDL